jgi:hypothetical protein
MTSPINGNAKNFDQIASQQQPCYGHTPQGPHAGSWIVG